MAFTSFQLFEIALGKYLRYKSFLLIEFIASISSQFIIVVCEHEKETIVILLRIYCPDNN
jgi:hypothetical protein